MLHAHIADCPVHVLLTIPCALAAACALHLLLVQRVHRFALGVAKITQCAASRSAESAVVRIALLFHRYVGASEENVRKLFEEAEADQQRNGDASELHVIIFDEIDAICKSRGSVRDGSGDDAWISRQSCCVTVEGS